MENPKLPQWFYDEIEASLGGTLVDIELGVDEYDICYRKAVRVFKQRGNSSYRREFFGLDVKKGQRTYQLPKTNDFENGIRVVDTIVRVIRPSFSMFNMEDAFSMAAYQELNQTRGYSQINGNLYLLTYELTLWMKENHERYSAHAVDFNHDHLTHNLMLMNTPKKDEIWFLDCYVENNPEDLVGIDWIVRWTIAEAKIMLGNAYRKFSTLSGPTGEFGLHGAEFIADGNAEKEALLGEIEAGVDGASENAAVEIIIG